MEHAREPQKRESSLEDKFYSSENVKCEPRHPAQRELFDEYRTYVQGELFTNPQNDYKE